MAITGMAALLGLMPRIDAGAALGCWWSSHAEEQLIRFVPAPARARMADPGARDRPMKLAHDPLREGEIPREQKLQPWRVGSPGRMGRVATTELGPVDVQGEAMIAAARWTVAV